MTQLGRRAPSERKGVMLDEVELEELKRDCEEEWSHDESLKREFGTFEIFWHFRKATAQGRAQISKNASVIIGERLQKERQ